MEKLPIFLALVVVVSWSNLHWVKDNYYFVTGMFSLHDMRLHLFRDHREQSPVVLQVSLGSTYKFRTRPTQCWRDGGESSRWLMCLDWPGEGRLILRHPPNYHSPLLATCYEVDWQSEDEDFEVTDCVEIGDSHWYGGPQIRSQRWPIERSPTPMQQYLSSDIGLIPGRKTYGSVLERYWLSSGGAAITVDDSVPLHYSINQSHLCLRTSCDRRTTRYKCHKWMSNRLKYKICIKPDVKSVHWYMNRFHLKKPSGVPNVELFKAPIWSTWARYKMNIDQNKTVTLAKEIKDNGFPCSQIEIDDMYTPTYGDFTFDKKKFPKPKEMTDAIHKLGCKVSSWVTPFANPDSKAFKEGLEKGYFVKDESGSVPGLTKWWQGVGALLDVTNPDAVSWYTDRLKALQKMGMDTFKFDAGEVEFLPRGYETDQQLINPNHYSRLYAEMAYQHFGDRVEVRAAYKSQHLPIMVRMMDMESDWGYNKGLRSMIPTALLFGITGYPFVLPDMVGGNAYANGSILGGALPEKELFIRWLQVNVFMPFIQFSICPWQYDKETVSIVKKHLEIREKHVLTRLQKAAEESVLHGDPIIRPLWWFDSTDKNTFDIDSQFLVADDMLVAPILHKGAIMRDIYLPKGQWVDMLSGNAIQGVTFLKDYKVSLHETPYFILQKETEHRTGS